MIEIHRNLSIPEHELHFTASRAGGPGGQHVNKVNTRVTLTFDLDGSRALDDGHKRRIRQRLGTRITRDGTLRVSCGRHRSQAANRREATERFADLLRRALARRKRRLATGVPASERRRRIEDKKRRGRLKSDRRVRVEGER